MPALSWLCLPLGAFKTYLSSCYWLISYFLKLLYYLINFYLRKKKKKKKKNLDLADDLPEHEDSEDEQDPSDAPLPPVPDSIAPATSSRRSKRLKAEPMPAFVYHDTPSDFSIEMPATIPPWFSV